MKMFLPLKFGVTRITVS